jgi:hypothetical protein
MESSMQYLLLIYADEAIRAEMRTEQAAQYSAAFRRCTEDFQAAGQFVGGNALLPTNTAATIRVRNGKPIATDGPFAETREQLGGYYLIEAKNLDEAIKAAAKIPSAAFGSIEIRPIMVMPARAA